jgi:hypothetical protein
VSHFRDGCWTAVISDAPPPRPVRTIAVALVASAALVDAADGVRRPCSDAPRDCTSVFRVVTASVFDAVKACQREPRETQHLCGRSFDVPLRPASGARNCATSSSGEAGFGLSTRFRRLRAEGVGFEPTVDQMAHNGFRDRCDWPRISRARAEFPLSRWPAGKASGKAFGVLASWVGACQRAHANSRMNNAAVGSSSDWQSVWAAGCRATRRGRQGGRAPAGSAS